MNNADLIRAAYPELRVMAGRLMRSERDNHTLQPTALVNEALIRLMGTTPEMPLGQFLAFASRAMRNVLVDYARAHNSLKRGGEWIRVPINDAEPSWMQDPDSVIELNKALERLGALDPLALSVVELKHFGGFNIEEIMLILGVSERRVKTVWHHARLWLYRELAKPID